MGVVCSWTYEFLVKWSRIFWIPNDLIKRDGKNSWVLITGGANGIGRRFAIEFAKLGFNIIIIDKDEIGIEHLKNEIKNFIDRKIGFKGILADFKNIWKEDSFNKIDL